MFEVKNNIFEMEIMMSVRIIIDSASDLTKQFLVRKNIWMASH